MDPGAVVAVSSSNFTGVSSSPHWHLADMHRKMLIGAFLHWQHVRACNGGPVAVMGGHGSPLEMHLALSSQADLVTAAGSLGFFPWLRPHGFWV